MIIKTIVDECFGDYKKPAMYICSVFCDGKCYKELNQPSSMCQNNEIKAMPMKDVPNERIVERYLSNDLTSAVVIAGLEPLMQTEEVIELIKKFRKHTQDDIILYSGYYLEEEPVVKFIKMCKDNELKNIILKVGRYRPDLPSRFDDILGIELISNNQYALKIDDIKEY